MYFYQHFRTKFAGLYVYAFSGGNSVKFIIQAGGKPRFCRAAETGAPAVAAGSVQRELLYGNYAAAYIQQT